MNDGIQLAEPPPAKRDVGQPGTIQATIRLHDCRPEDADDFYIDCLPRLHERAAKLIRLDHFRAQFAEESGDGALAAAQPARQPNAQQRYSPRRIRAARTVFDMSMAMVS